MKAKVHKFIAVENGMTAREIVNAIAEVVKEEGEVAWGWPVMIMEARQEERPHGIDTGMAASMPDVKEGDIGFKKRRRV